MRILALVEDASLAVALTQMPFGHDVVAIDSIEQLEGHDLSFQVALVDLGTTRRGLVGASDIIRSGVSAPCVVVGDENALELAIELAPDASVIVRPFPLEELDARLEELAIFALGLRQEDLESEVHTESALHGDVTASNRAVPVNPVEPAAASRSGEWPPQVQFRKRESENLDPEDQARVERTRSLLAEGAQLERFLDRVPEVVDRRAVAERLLATVEHNLRPLVSVLWVPSEDGGYEPLAQRHLDRDQRVPFDQALFLSFETNLDAVLVVQVDPLQHPVEGIPGVEGETLIAAALRVGEALRGVVMAAGEGYTEVERDQLQLLAVESAPALAVAEVFERMRPRQLPTTTQSPADTSTE